MTSIIERVKSINDAYQETGRPRVAFNNVPDDLKEVFEGFYDSIVQTEAFNEGWKPDFSNPNQRKWLPWFDQSSSGFAFYDSYYVCSAADAGFASRLFLKSKALSDHLASTPAFMSAYEKLNMK